MWRNFLVPLKAHGVRNSPHCLCRLLVILIVSTSIQWALTTSLVTCKRLWQHLWEADTIIFLFIWGEHWGWKFKIFHSKSSSFIPVRAWSSPTVCRLLCSCLRLEIAGCQVCSAHLPPSLFCPLGKQLAQGQLHWLLYSFSSQITWEGA